MTDLRSLHETISLALEYFEAREEINPDHTGNREAYLARGLRNALSAIGPVDETCRTPLPTSPRIPLSGPVTAHPLHLEALARKYSHEVRMFLALANGDIALFNAARELQDIVSSETVLGSALRYTSPPKPAVPRGRDFIVEVERPRDPDLVDIVVEL